MPISLPSVSPAPHAAVGVDRLFRRATVDCLTLTLAALFADSISSGLTGIWPSWIVGIGFLQVALAVASVVILGSSGSYAASKGPLSGEVKRIAFTQVGSALAL